MDLQKAFDTVNHDILLHKLYNCGIRGKMHDWIRDYLSNRKQFTVVGAMKSSLSSIHCGVPQGSVLGPILFLIYVNDICNAIDEPKPRIFADDTNLFIFDKNITSLSNKCNEALLRIYDWMLANKLSLNIEKTCYSLFATPSKQNPSIALQLSVNNIKIQRSCC